MANSGDESESMEAAPAWSSATVSRVIVDAQAS